MKKYVHIITHVYTYRCTRFSTTEQHLWALHYADSGRRQVLHCYPAGHGHCSRLGPIAPSVWSLHWRSSATPRFHWHLPSSTWCSRLKSPSLCRWPFTLCQLYRRCQSSASYSKLFPGLKRVKDTCRQSSWLQELSMEKERPRGRTWRTPQQQPDNGSTPCSRIEPPIRSCRRHRILKT